MSANPSVNFSKSIPCITGRQMSAEQFVLHETDLAPDPVTFRRLLHGDALGMLVKGYLPPKVCSAITEEFLKETEGHDRTDDVSAREVGTGHYGKSLQDYLDQVQENREALARLYKGAEHIPEKMAEDIQRALDHGMTLRAAVYCGRSAEKFRAAMWKNSGKYSLRPHEDLSQLFDPRQIEFEIQNVLSPVAINVYVSMPEKGGQLRVWNIAPDNCTRERLGVATTGHPYPIEALADVPFIDVYAKAGDVAIINGRFLHAVIESDASAPRIVVNGFCGVKRDGSTVIQWT